MNRRTFIKVLGAAALGDLAQGVVRLAPASAAAGSAQQDSGQEGTSPMRTRKLGRTGHRSSLITFGGIIVAGMAQHQADHVVAAAIDAGVNGFDVAPSYHDAELRLGPALRGKRDRIFLQCKTLERSRDGAARELRQSLQRLETDHVDLYQLHGVNEIAELDQALGPGGAMEAFLAARQAGLIRFIGITGHRPATLAQALRRFPFDTVMVPLNFVLEHHSGFAQEVLREASQRGVGVIAIKALAARPWRKGEKRKYPMCWYRPLEDREAIGAALRFALSFPVATVIPPGDERLLRHAVAAAQAYRRCDAADRAMLEMLAQRLQPIF